jgi:hypothetical protein
VGCHLCIPALLREVFIGIYSPLPNVVHLVLANLLLLERSQMSIFALVEQLLMVDGLHVLNISA